MGQEESLLRGAAEDDELMNVGIPPSVAVAAIACPDTSASVLSLSDPATLTVTASFDYANPRATFPSLWPFGGKQRGSDENVNEWAMDGVRKGLKRSVRSGDGFSSRDGGEKGFEDVYNDEGEDADGAFVQREINSSDEDSDDEAGYGGGGSGKFGGDGQGVRARRRLSTTTEAKRRTSLDDEDEVVHVGMEQVEGGEADEELVEIGHVEVGGAE